MTHDERAFITAICAEPADDTARLVYADWLEEHGDRPDRAEFIRVQINLASRRIDQAAVNYWNEQLDCPDWVKEVNALRERERKLYVTNAAEDVWPQAVSAWADNYTFGRGFLCALTCTAADWLAHAGALHWRPEQTEACPRCKGLSSHWISRTPGTGMYDVCESCMNKGRVGRACPDTAQPITDVALTDFPRWDGDEDYAWIMGNASDGPHRIAWADIRRECTTVEFDRDDVFAAFLRLRWPGLTITLP